MNRFNVAVPSSVRALCFLLLLAGNAQAAIYKWVDKDGNVQYTQTPPPEGMTAETLQPPMVDVNSDTAIKQLNEQQHQLKDLDKQRQEQSEQEAKVAEAQALRQKNCQTAKDRLASYEKPRGIRLEREDGTRERISEEERQEQIKISEDMIKEYCE